MSRVESERRRRRRRERKSQKSQKEVARSQNHSADVSICPQDNALRLLSYTITEDRFEEPSNYAALDNLSADKRADLFDQVHDDPQSAIPRLQILLEKSPDSPVLHNWLISAYQALGNEEAAEKTAHANYARHPDYLFAKLNVAQFALKKGELDRFREIFDGKFDLKLLYPDRDVFHISEFIGFAALMIQYFVRIGKQETAELLFDVMEQIAPDAPATRAMREVIEHAAMLRVIEMAIQRLANPRSRRRVTSRP